MDDTRAVLLRGEGRAFSLGGDVGAFVAADGPEQLVGDLAEALHRTISDLHRMDAVVVSFVHGVAAGAGAASGLAPGAAQRPAPPPAGQLRPRWRAGGDPIQLFNITEF